MVFILSEEYADSINKSSYNIINLNDPNIDFKITKDDDSGYVATVIGGGFDKFLFKGRNIEDCSKIIGNVINYNMRNPDGVVDIKAFLIPEIDETKQYTMSEIHELMEEILTLHGYSGIVKIYKKMVNNDEIQSDIDNLHKETAEVATVMEEYSCQTPVNALYVEPDQLVLNG